MLARRVTALLAVLALGLGAAACGGGGESPEDVVKEAAAKTADAGTVRYSATTSMRGSGQAFVLPGQGVFDYRNARGRMSFDFRQYGRGIGLRSMELVYDGDVSYLKSRPALFGEWPGQPWVKFDYDALAQGKSAARLHLVQQFDQNPLQQSQFLRAVGETVDEVGTEDVRGVSTTHYRTTVNLEQAIQISKDGQTPLPKSVRRPMGVEADRLADEAGRAELPADVWIDDDGRLRRLKMSFDFRSEAGPTTIDITLELFDFGTKVEVAPPPAAQVRDIEEILGLGG